MNKKWLFSILALLSVSVIGCTNASTNASPAAQTQVAGQTEQEQDVDAAKQDQGEEQTGQEQLEAEEEQDENEEDQEPANYDAIVVVTKEGTVKSLYTETLSSLSRYMMLLETADGQREVIRIKRADFRELGVGDQVVAELKYDTSANKKRYGDKGKLVSAKVHRADQQK